MKILVITLSVLQLTLTEVPPSYRITPHRPLLLPLISQQQKLYSTSQQYTAPLSQRQYVASSVPLGRISNRPQNTGRIVNGGLTPVSQPQTVYGPPKFQQAFQLPQSNQWSPIAQKPSQVGYRPPNTLSQVYGVPQQPQTTYGPPPSVPQQTYGVPNKVQTVPSQAYGAPSKVQNTQFQNSYGAPSPHNPNIETLERLKDQQSLSVIPLTQQLPVKEPVYFQKLLNNVQSLPLREADNFRRNNVAPLPTQQYLPVKDAQDFRGFQRNTAISNSFQGDFDGFFPGNANQPRPHTTVDIQKVDVMRVTPVESNGGNNFPPLNDQHPNSFPADNNNGFPVEDRTTKPIAPGGNRRPKAHDNGYIPPTTTTEGPVLRKPTKRSKTTTTTSRPQIQEDSDDGNESEKPTEAEEDNNNNDDDEGAPNVAIATAVAGGGARHFYLLRPDGKLQRVLLEKVQEPGDAENEYTANYLFQNVQPEPNVVYAPLLSLANK